MRRIDAGWGSERRLQALNVSQKHKKKSNKKDVASDAKKPEKTEMMPSHIKEQLNQRLSDKVALTKTRRSMGLKESTKVSLPKNSKETHYACDNLIPLEERKKISINFKNKTKRGGKRNNMASVAALLGQEDLDSKIKRKEKELQDLRILKTKKKNKKKDKVNLNKLKEIIKGHGLVEFKDALQPTDISPPTLALNLYEFSSKTGGSNASAFNFPDPKMHTQNSREGTLKRAKHASLEGPKKNEKVMKCRPLCHGAEQSEHWRGERKKDWCTDPAKIVNVQESAWESVILQRSQFQSPKDLSPASFETLADTNADEEMQIVEDLHTARNDKKLVLPVVQTCGELTSMEIDLPDEESKFVRMLAGLNTLIVVDTNIMISHLEFIKSLKNKDIPGIGIFVLVIPWVVLQELDNLKRGKILANVRQKAIPAVHFIYMCLKNQDPKLWGQSMQLASQKTHNFVVENNDDCVLQCCLQHKNLFPQAEVVLLTNDKNLCNKALVSEVKAFTKVDFVTALQKLVPKAVDIRQDTSCSRSQPEKADVYLWESSQKTVLRRTIPSTSSTIGPYQSIQTAKLFHQTLQPVLAGLLHSNTLSPKTVAVTTDQFSGLIFDTKKCLGEVLSCILETELKIVYGEHLWTEVVYYKPPWTLTNVLECYKKHWIAVFGFIISRSFSSTIDFLYEQLCKDNLITHSHLGKVLQKSKILLETFCPRSNYDGALPRAVNQMEKLLESLEKLQSGTRSNFSDFKSTSVTCEKMEDVALTQEIQVGDKSLASEPLAKGNRHVEIWSVLQSVWDTVNQFSIEVFQKLDPSTITNSQEMTSFKDALDNLQKLMAAVSQILSGIQQVLVSNSSFQDVWPLYTFLINSEINNTKFTAEELYDCISQEMYRNRLSVGYMQLVQLERTIKQHYESICLEMKNRGWL